jgi:hypothetical protein
MKEDEELRRSRRKRRRRRENGEMKKKRRLNCNKTDGGEERAVRRSRRYIAEWDYEIERIKGKVRKEDNKII